MDNIYDIVSNAYLSSEGKHIKDEDISYLLKYTNGIFDFNKSIKLYPKHFFYTVFENKNFYNKIAYPCNTIELREILENKKIYSLQNLVFTSLSLAKEVIRDYNYILVIKNDVSDKDFDKFGGIAIYNKNSFNINEDLHSIIVINDNNNIMDNNVDNILNDLDITIPVYDDYFISGIDSPKFSSELKEFVINLDKFDIKDRKVKAYNKKQALNSVLKKIWKNKGNYSINDRIDPMYTAEYWEKTPFWDQIVKENKKNKYANVQSGATVNLNNQEQNIFNLILAIAEEFDLNTTFRVAGGWVRDKLLNTPSDDIDIALSDITGSQFKKYVNLFKEKYPNSPIGKDYVVEENVEKSKHLETVAIEMYGLKVDFVNLRSETYGEDSRIPEMQFGTPQTDAERRDLTINALYYNINTGQVEDYVGGLKDLQSMTLRTPLEPNKTFKDDPLRMLRVLRFYSRYDNAKIDPSIIVAMGNPEIHESYRSKVAPSRGGPEILKMMKGNSPDKALNVLLDTGLEAAVFDVPERQGYKDLRMDQRNRHHKYNLWDHTVSVVKNVNEIMKRENISDDQRALMNLAALFHDYGKAHPEIGKPKEKNPEEYSYIGHEHESAKVSNSILKKMGLNKHDRDFISKIISLHMRPHTKQWSDKAKGKFLRESVIPGQEDKDNIWWFVMQHAIADSMSKGDDSYHEDVDLKKKHIQEFVDYQNKPDKVHMSPIINGNVIKNFYSHIDPKTGYIKYVIDKLMDEQYSGNIKNEQEAMKFLETIKPEIEENFMPKESKTKSYFSLQKLADASSGSRPDGGLTYSVYEGQNWLENQPKRMIRYSPGNNSSIKNGDRVRRRTSSLLSSETGRVISKKKNVITVKWESGTKEKFDLNSIETPFKIQRI